LLLAERQAVALAERPTLVPAERSHRVGRARAEEGRNVHAARERDVHAEAGALGELHPELGAALDAAALHRPNGSPSSEVATSALHTATVASVSNRSVDMGESFGRWALGDDAGGDPRTMRKTVALAVEHGVHIGAHVALPDLLGFGRPRMTVSPEDLTDYCTFQIGGSRRSSAPRAAACAT
jgi:hypothetical protein